jgi:hypothetical protein
MDVVLATRPNCKVISRHIAPQQKPLHLVHVWVIATFHGA